MAFITVLFGDAKSICSFMGKLELKPVSVGQEKIAFSTEIFIFNKINLCCMN